MRRKGWQRIALFANFFMPGALVTLEDDVWLKACRTVLILDPLEPSEPMKNTGLRDQ